MSCYMAKLDNKDIGMRWEYVPNFESYEASDAGEIRRVDSQKPIRLSNLNSGYAGCTLHQDGDRWSTTAHRVIAVTFLGAPPTESHEVNHKNGNKRDNRADNLEWVTRSENEAHKYNVLGCRSLSENEVMALVEERNTTGASYTLLAKKYGVSPSHIGHIFTGRTWSHLWEAGRPVCKMTGLQRNQYMQHMKSEKDVLEKRLFELMKEMEEIKRKLAEIVE